MWRDGSGPSGQMTSPNFTTGKFFFSRAGAAPYGKYPNSFHESKTIKVEKGHLVKLHFTDFDLAWTEDPDLKSTSHKWLVEHTPVADYVEITDGDGTFLGKFGPQHKPYDNELLRDDVWGTYKFVGILIPDIISFTDTVHVLFHTDERANATGWHLEWSSITPSEKELPTGGVLSSPKGSDGRYPNNLNQIQKIQVPEGFTIWIRFTQFHVEGMDNVTITDKDGTSPGQIDGNPGSDNFWHFGDKEILSNTNIVSVQFKTDAISDKYSFGWRLMWGLVRDGWRRSGVLTSLNFPKAYPTSFSSDDVIRVSPFNTIKFRFTNFSLASDDHVYLSEEGRDSRGWGGQWGGYITPRLSGNSLPEDVTSPHHVVHVNFFSNAHSVETGWRLEWIEEGKPCNASRQLNPVAAFLSSEYVDPKNTSVSYNLGAEKCIDGITDGPDSGNPGDDLCHTSYPPPPDPKRPWIHNYPWLAIDFGVEVFVKKVVLFNRRECCYSRTRNLTISASNSLPVSESDMFYGGYPITYFSGPGEPGQQIEETNMWGWNNTNERTKERPGWGRYLIIQVKKAAEPLNLKEVIAFGWENTPGVNICEKPY